MLTARSLVVACAVVAGAVGVYALARQTSMFAISRIELRGAPSAVAAQVRRAVADWRGTSLVGLDGAELIRRVDAVPWVVRARYDRAFPHTLRLTVETEEPVAVLRSGRAAWLVSARGRVLTRLARARAPVLPRVWVPAASRIEAGETLADAEGGAASRALAPLVHARFPVRIETSTLRRGELVFVLGRGVELRLGRPTDLRLKLAIARRIVRALPAGTTYIDVSVPERPVSGRPLLATNPQLSG
jgi:cell division protein FtsQ